jgi:hypothetical protein
MSMLKYLVCTMYCGEPDLPHHLKAMSQQGVEVDHRIISYKREVDAHNAVYSAFNEASSEWIRAKIDADVVLTPGMLARIEVPDNMWLDPQTHDYFTDKPLHAGVAIYGSSIRFRVQTDALKCDRNVIIPPVNQHGIGVIGTHAAYADEFTGFHFGFHRGLKSQLPVYEDLVAAYKRHGDRVRLMAIRGFELGQSDRYKDWHLGGSPVTGDHNYGEGLKKLFEEFKGDNPPSLTRTWR